MQKWKDFFLNIIIASSQWCHTVHGLQQESSWVYWSDLLYSFTMAVKWSYQQLFYMCRQNTPSHTSLFSVHDSLFSVCVSSCKRSLLLYTSAPFRWLGMSGFFIQHILCSLVGRPLPWIKEDSSLLRAEPRSRGSLCFNKQIANPAYCKLTN